MQRVGSKEQVQEGRARVKSKRAEQEGLKLVDWKHLKPQFSCSILITQYSYSILFCCSLLNTVAQYSILLLNTAFVEMPGVPEALVPHFRDKLLLPSFCFANKKDPSIAKAFCPLRGDAGSRTRVRIGIELRFLHVYCFLIFEMKQVKQIPKTSLSYLINSNLVEMG